MNAHYCATLVFALLGVLLGLECVFLQFRHFYIFLLLCLGLGLLDLLTLPSHVHSICQILCGHFHPDL